MSSPDPALLSVNTATVRAQWPLPDIIGGLARHGIRGIAPWRDQVARTGLAQSARLIRGAGLTVSGYIRGGLFPATTTQGLRAAVDDNRRAIDEAVEVGARCLVLIAGGLPKDANGRPASKDLIGAHAMVRDGIAQLLEHARAARMPLAIEPLHPMYAADRGCVNSLRHALDLCEALAPNDTDLLGVAVDVYHVWWDPELESQISRAGRARRLFAYHLCDWLVPTTDMLNDRGMMGDGVIDLPRIRGWMEDAGYRGQHEVEIFSDRWWAADPDDVLRTLRSRYDTAT